MDQYNENKERSTKPYRHSYNNYYLTPRSSVTSPALTIDATHSPKTQSHRANSRHFHSNPFGLPPGQTTATTANHNNNTNNSINNNSIKRRSDSHSIIPTTSISSPLLTSSSNRTAPLKELQKMITDLKKENFDLKLQLFHLEDSLKKEDIEKCRLLTENKRLNSDLEECLNQKRRLELALDHDIEFLLKNEKHYEKEGHINYDKMYYDASTQTIEKEEKDYDSSSSPLYNNSKHHHLFPTDPASFGLMSTRYLHTTQPAIEPFDTIVDQFSSVKLAMPKKPSLNYNNKKL
ncbi:unnamed protein product [Cunninghamella echinulata]